MTGSAADCSNLDHGHLKTLAQMLGRPLSTVTVLANDPFSAGQAARHAGAEWLAEVWQRLAIQPGAHLRRVHYVLVSQVSPIALLSGEPYINTEFCWKLLGRTSLDARYLGLIQNFTVDRRNAEPVIHRADVEDCGAEIACEEGSVSGKYDVKLEPPIWVPPRLKLFHPITAQRYHVELWCEKSTVNDVLMPLGERFGINIVTGLGELSHTRCVELVARAQESQKPVRILYISDFDPAGDGMPVAVARKIEFELYRQDLTYLDIQVRPVALTHEQCIRYRLPRIPLKQTERRAERFESRFGEGATELDALEALHPGELRRILVHEISRYYDLSLARRMAEVTDQVQADIAAIERGVMQRHAGALRELAAERERIREEFEELQARKEALGQEFKEKAAPILQRIEEDLAAGAPSADDYEWPEPAEGDEDEDPLFDPERGYLAQIDRYKRHQGKPTGRRSRSAPEPFTKTCEGCGKPFLATRADARTCGPTCRSRLARATDK